MKRALFIPDGHGKYLPANRDATAAGVIISKMGDCPLLNSHTTYSIAFPSWINKLKSVLGRDLFLLSWGYVTP